MRVLHVSEVSWGGIPSLLRDFTAEQVRRGHRVSLLIPTPMPDRGLAGVHRLDWSIDRRRASSLLPAVRQLRAAVRRERPDVVHLHSAFAGFLGRLPLLAGTAGVPLVYQPHAWSFEIHTSGWARRLTEAWERVASRWTDVLVTNCTDEVDQGRELGIRTPGYALGVPLDVERFHPQADPAHWKARAGVQQPRMLLCLGRLARQKGQDLLVRAWEAEPLPDTELLLVGPGDTAPYQALAPTQWGSTIRWVGDQSDVRPYLWACDALVLPSRYETVAVVVAEAMACGRPVVATRVNGVEMAVTDGPADPGGVVVAAGDAGSLLAEAHRLLTDEDRRRTLGAAGRQRVVDLFTPKLVVDRLDEAYAAAVAGPGGMR